MLTNFIIKKNIDFSTIKSDYHWYPYSKISNTLTNINKNLVVIMKIKMDK